MLVDGVLHNTTNVAHFLFKRNVILYLLITYVIIIINKK